jgi:hypothetical protein
MLPDKRVYSTAGRTSPSIAAVTGAPIELVLFDLGGVLIAPGGVAPMRELSGLDSDDALWTRWLSCRWVRRFEAGGCTPEEFAAGMVEDWELELEPTAFLRAFGGWPEPPYDGALELVAAVQAAVPAGFLSNANVLQWIANYEGIPLTEAFAYRFLSFELGLVKPDAPYSTPWRRACLSPAVGCSSSTTTCATWRRPYVLGSPPGTYAGSGQPGTRSCPRACSEAEAGRVSGEAPVPAPVPTCGHGCQRPDAASLAAPE